MKSFISILLTGLICLNNYNLSAQNAPIATIGDAVSYSNTIVVPITVTGFSNISVCDLTLNYDSEIATVTSVTEGPGVIHSFFIPDYTEPGTIVLSWFYYSGLTIPDDSVFINITFERIAYGYSAIEFDNSLPNDCLWGDSDANELNDTPFSTYYIDGSVAFEMINAPVTSAPVEETCQGSTTIDIPVTVSDFYQIGAFKLTMQYDAQSFSYQSFTNDSGFPGLEVVENSPGTIVIDGLFETTEGFTLDNNSILCTVHFNNLGGSTAISWLDIGESCEFKGPAPDYELLNDSPQSFYYITGSITELLFPAQAGSITGPEGGIVCPGASGVIFSISPIAFANNYEWTLPEGATLDDGDGNYEVSVSFSEDFMGGDISVFGVNECGNGIESPLFSLTADLAPSIINQPVSPDTINAGAGIADFSVTSIGTDLFYQWQEYIDEWTDITDGGVYSGSTSSFLTITNPPVTMNGNYYRCIVNGNCSPPAISDGNAILTIIVYTGIDTPDHKNVDENDYLEFKSYPNPFSEQITFDYRIPSMGMVTIEITNVYGEKVAVLTNNAETKGDQLLSFDAKHLMSGIYIATITFKSDKKLIRNTFKIISDI